MKITMLGLDFNRIMKVCIPALDKVGTRRATEYIEIRCADGIGTATACDGISLAHCQFNYEGDEGCFLLPRHRNVANGALITITIKGNSISVSDGDEKITRALCTDDVPNWGTVVLERAAKRRTASITLSARRLRNIMRSFDSLDDAVTFEIAGDLDSVILRSSRTYGLLLPIRNNGQRNLAQYIRPLVAEDVKGEPDNGN